MATKTKTRNNYYKLQLSGFYENIRKNFCQLSSVLQKNSLAVKVLCFPAPEIFKKWTARFNESLFRFIIIADQTVILVVPSKFYFSMIQCNSD